MKKNAFTLVELLAVIIIIGLIALITIPKINKEVEKSQENLAQTSAQKYKEIIEEYILKQKMNKNVIILNGTYTITQLGYLSDGENTYEISFNGEKPSGYIIYNNNIITEAQIQINNYCIEFENNEIKDTQRKQCSNP